MMDVSAVLGAEMRQDPSGVWTLYGHERFDYSDGAESEVYLESVLDGAQDLGSKSVELEKYIRDWPSEYHLSPKRSNLLAGLQFSRSARVLEIGCGCGAITRYLGETFDSVLAVEGSSARARLARLRTRDLAGVEIACAPFQRLAPKRKFDLIFCVGVLEYSELFVEASDPFDQVLKQLASWLDPGGTLVVAIENQFGLKYLNGFREDHLGIPFEGLEGYHGRPAGPRTFGRGELASMLGKHFSRVDFLYPFPDYKIPSSVVRHEFLASGEAAEIVAGVPSRDYHSPSRGLWDESLVTMELGRNGMLPDVANSFLVLASTTGEARCAFPQQAILFSDDRLPEFRTVTKVGEDGQGRLLVRKALAGGMTSVVAGAIRLHAYVSDWRFGQSLESILFARSRRAESDLEEIFSVCRDWVRALREECVDSGFGPMLPGRLLDATWRNTFLNERELRFIDQEWEWHEALPLNVVVIRAIYVFLCHAEGKRQLHPSLADRNARRLIGRIGACIGLQFSAQDFEQFVQVQAEVHGQIRGADRARTATMLRWFLIDRRLLMYVMRAKESFSSVAACVNRRLRGNRVGARDGFGLR